MNATDKLLAYAAGAGMIVRPTFAHGRVEDGRIVTYDEPRAYVALEKLDGDGGVRMVRRSIGVEGNTIEEAAAELLQLAAV